MFRLILWNFPFTFLHRNGKYISFLVTCSCPQFLQVSIFLFPLNDLLNIFIFPFYFPSQRRLSNALYFILYNLFSNFVRKFSHLNLFVSFNLKNDHIFLHGRKAIKYLVLVPNFVRKFSRLLNFFLSLTPNEYIYFPRFIETAIQII